MAEFNDLDLPPVKEIRNSWYGKLLNIDPNNELSDEEYIEALQNNKSLKRLSNFLGFIFENFSGEQIVNTILVVILLLFIGFLLVIAGLLSPLLQSLFHNIQHAYSENINIDNLRKSVHALKEALNNAREFWDNA